MGERGGGPRRLRGFVAGLRKTGGGCWRLKGTGAKRIPTHPLELATRSARHRSQRLSDSQQFGQKSEVLNENHDRPSFLRGTSSRRVGMPESHQVHINDDERPGPFANNSIKTSKYNPLTFLPKFLFEMFSRVAYLYFLLQAGLSWWDVVSPFGGLGATAALSFVLLMSGGKAIIEDFKRHVEDDKTNNSEATIVNPLTGEESSIKWKNISVGDIVKVCDDELFPADLLCLDTGLADGVCFIRTTNLDGESNLKIRKPVDLRSIPNAYSSPREEKNERWVFRHTAILECEPPNRNLHKFKGRFIVAQNNVGESSEDKHITIPTSMNEMLLRGTILKNSKHVYGLVVYTGHSTRIQMNAAKVPLKVGSFDQFLNLQITLVIIAQIILCVILALANLWWRDTLGVVRDHLAFDSYVEGNYESGIIYFALVFLTFWILTAYMVPISLFVTMEIVKFWQAFVFINNDPSMSNGEEGAKARNSNLNEDLGKIEYVFSDKTGTLTSNDMQLRLISIKNRACGRQECRLEELSQDMHGMPGLETFDESLAQSVKQLKENGLWANLVETGGSRQFVLSLADSNPKLQKMGSVDRGTLREELTEFCNRGNPENTDDPDASVDLLRPGINSAEAMDSLSAKNLKICSQDVNDVILGWHIVDFWMNVCICHSLIIEEHTDDDGNVQRIYQGPSPDEVALVEAARKLGFEFVDRTKTEIVLSMQGLEVRFEVLNVLEFTSERKRMSVVAQAPDGTIHLFVKGADSVMLPRLKRDASSGSVMKEAEESLHDYSVMGLRTLVLGSRILDEETYWKWDGEYQDVAGSLSAGRDEEMNRMAEKLEVDLHLVGITAIEDKLQEGVPRAIQTLRMAGMKVWMITGDKMETAINIAISCQLITDQDTLLVFKAEHHRAARDKLHDLTREAEARRKAGLNAELVVDGPSLVHVLGKSFESQLAYLGSLCSGVVICRSSPSQKATVVRIMREFELSEMERGRGGPLFRFFRRKNGVIKTKMLAIGDGANDVTMIQAADIGVGIAGKEGRQAVNNSDYSISQFRYLVRLLLVHGQLSHYRLARLIKFSFFKNITFAFILIFYQLYCGYSGQALVDDISAAMFNVIFTSLPILLFAVLDKVLDDKLLMRFPQMYNRSTSLSTPVFWRSGVIQGIVNAAICFFIPYYSASAEGSRNTDSLWAVGKTIYVALLVIVTMEVALVSRYWTAIFLVFTFLSLACVFPYLLLFPYAEQLVVYYDQKQYGIAENLFSSPSFWLCVLAIAVISFGYRYYIRVTKWLFNPDDNMILAEFESMKGALSDLSHDEQERLTALDVIPSPLEATNRSNGRAHVTVKNGKEVELQP